MSEQYAGDPVWADDFTLQDDSVPATCAAVNPALEALGNRTAWLREYIATFNAFRTPVASLAALTAITTPTNGLARIVKKYGLYVFDTASVIPAFSPWVLAADDATTGRWVRAGLTLRQAEWRTMNPFGGMCTKVMVARSKGAAFASDARYYDGTNNQTWSDFSNGVQVFRIADAINGIASGLMWRLDEFLWHGATLSLVEARVQGGAGHASLPAFPMSVGVFRVPTFGGLGGLASLLSSGDFTDSPAATGPDYDAAHTIYLTPNQNHVIDKRTYSYFLQFWNEWGFNALPGASLIGVNLYQNNVFEGVYG